MADNEDLLKEIRERFDRASAAWANIRAEAATDRRFLAGDGWDPAERRRREKASRPIVSFDELTQYVNQVVNQARENKRAIEVTPRGDGANDQTALLRAETIRDIEYRSNAQAAYIRAFEGQVGSSYGFARVSRCYCDSGSFNQELRIKAILNPDSVYLDPDFKEPDGSDAKWALVVEPIPLKDFEKRFPDATPLSFGGNTANVAPGWLNATNIQIAEYFYIKEKKRTLFMLDNATPEGWSVYKDELPKGTEITKNAVTSPDGVTMAILKQRPTEERTIYKCLTNGFEILEGPSEEPGEYIPIAGCFGKELWVDGEGGPERRFHSLIRLARGPQMAFNYYKTTGMEMVGQVSKSPWLGAIGQFHNQDEWNSSNSVPLGFLQYDPTPDSVPEGTVLGPPVRIQWEPATQALELSAESARRGIQAAMGISSLPTAAQRQSEKSGVALERIATQQSQGSFHFADNFDRFLAHMGRIINSQMPVIYDTPRDQALRSRDDTVRVVRLNEPYKDEKGADQHHDMSVGEHEVTVSAGPSYQSQRDKADEFATQLVTPELLGAAIAGNPKAAKLSSLAIKLQNGGPIMDQIADVLDPEQQGSAEQSQAQVQQLTQQLQQAGAIIQELKQKADDNATKLQIAQTGEQTKRLIAAADNHMKGAIALMEHEGDAQRAVFLEASAHVDAELSRRHELTMAEKQAELAPPQPELQTQ